MQGVPLVGNTFLHVVTYREKHLFRTWRVVVGGFKNESSSILSIVYKVMSLKQVFPEFYNIVHIF